jgi:predicted lipoprotein
VDFPGVFGEGNRNTEKEKAMSNNNENRVLSRMGARQLTPKEIEQVAAAKLTFASVLITAPVSNPDESFDQ